jgi:hypothetical protein
MLGGWEQGVDKIDEDLMNFARKWTEWGTI